MTYLDRKSLYLLEIMAIVIVAITTFLMLVEIFPVKYIVDFQLIVYMFLVGTNYIRVKTFNFYQIWIFAYVFIIWSEMRIISEQPMDFDLIIPFVRYSFSNVAVLVGYHLFNKNNRKNAEIFYISKANKKHLFIATIVVLYAVFVAMSVQSAVNNFYYGRQLSSTKGGTTLTGSLLSALGTLLPAIIAYNEKILNKKNGIKSFLISLPIFAIVLLQSTRFKFLFSIIPYLIVTGIFDFGYESGRKKNVVLIATLVLLAGLSSFIKENRNIAFSEIEKAALFNENGKNSEDSFTLKLAKNMSPEGVVRMGYVADRYFSTHNLHYGKEMSFILYFWVPRTIWPSKPTQLDYWLIREYTSETVADTFSSASGFIGEARADFGWACVLFAFLFGFLLKSVDLYKQMVFAMYRESFNIVFVAILVPWVFFFVRSPLTSTMSLFWEIIVYYLFLKLFSSVSLN